MFIYDITVTLIYYSDYIACLGYFTLSVYAWGISLTYIRRRLSSRLHFHIFWEVGRKKVFLVSKSSCDLDFWLFIFART